MSLLKESEMGFVVGKMKYQPQLQLAFCVILLAFGSIVVQAAKPFGKDLFIVIYIYYGFMLWIPATFLDCLVDFAPFSYQVD